MSPDPTLRFRAQKFVEQVIHWHSDINSAPVQYDITADSKPDIEVEYSCDIIDSYSCDYKLTFLNEGFFGFRPFMNGKVPLYEDRVLFEALLPQNLSLENGLPEDLRLRDRDGNPTHKLDFYKIAKTYPDLFAILSNLRNNNQSLFPTLALLFRSPSFRAQLEKAKDLGYQFVVDPNSGTPWVNPENKTINLPLAYSAGLFLFYLPHELAHIDQEYPEPSPGRAAKF